MCRMYPIARGEQTTGPIGGRGKPRSHQHRPAPGIAEGISAGRCAPHAMEGAFRRSARPAGGAGLADAAGRETLRANGHDRRRADCFAIPQRALPDGGLERSLADAVRLRSKCATGDRPGQPVRPPPPHLRPRHPTITVIVPPSLRSAERLHRSLAECQQIVSQSCSDASAARSIAYSARYLVRASILVS
jgi:hypothetical protein